MITVYCLRRPADAPPPEGLTGPGGAPVEMVEEGGVVAWISEGAPVAPDIDAVRAHDAVVRAALRTATPVPTRFGTVFASEEELRASLRERAEGLRAALERVEGRVEMGVTVEWEEDEAPPAEQPVRTGRDYLERRRAEIEAEASRRERAEKVLAAVEGRIGLEGVPAVRTLLPMRGVAGTVAHLVHRQDVGVYRCSVQQAQSHLDKVRLRVTGPWAPYSFV